MDSALLAAQHCVAGFFRAHALRDVLLDLLFKMEAQFIVEFPFDLLFPKQCSQTEHDYLRVVGAGLRPVRSPLYGRG